ncbi:MAG: hypothetical protein ACYDE0_10825 [Acidiferrobacterales bacterium]
MVFLAIEPYLLGPADDSVVMACEPAFLSPDAAVAAAQMPGLPTVQFALPDLPGDAMILGCQAIIHLIASRMVAFECTVGDSGNTDAGQQGRQGQGHNPGGMLHAKSSLRVEGNRY